MQYTGTLIAVRDMEMSKRFYRDVLGLRVVDDFGANVMLEGGVFLQTLDTWKGLVRTDQVILPNHAGELYFETEDMDGFISHLKGFEVRYVHGFVEHGWGQRAVRFYDPDGHVVEVGEQMDQVVRRFIAQGLSPEATAKRMDVPLDFVRSCLKEY